MKFIKYKKVTGIIQCVSGLRIGGSKDTIEIGGMDNPIIRNPLDQFPYIPGSSLKGKLRSLLEWEIEGKLSNDGNVHQYKDCQDKECPICRIFGVTDNEALFGPGRAIFRDSWVSESSKAELKELQRKKGLLYVEEKTETAIDRLRGKAKGGSLRPYERVPAGTEFTFQIDYRVFDIDNDKGKVDNNNFDWILQGLWLLEQDALGGCGSRGYGQVCFGITNSNNEFVGGKVRVDGEEEIVQDRYNEITHNNKREQKCQNTD